MDKSITVHYHSSFSNNYELKENLPLAILIDFYKGILLYVNYIHMHFVSHTLLLLTLQVDVMYKNYLEKLKNPLHSTLPARVLWTEIDRETITMGSLVYYYSK